MSRLFNRKEKKVAPLPAVFDKLNDPVNYQSVLDYLVGLSDDEHTKITKVTCIYREANKKAAEVLGVKDEATTSLADNKPTDEEIDAGLDEALTIDELEYEDEGDDKVEKPTKPQGPSNPKKIEISA